jgi:hypothetical protein
MSQHTIKKIEEITQKIHHLKQEQKKLQSLLEKKIIDTLHRQGAFDDNFETLLSGISYVAQTLKRTDDNAQAICASWKSMQACDAKKSSPKEPLKKAS